VPECADVDLKCSKKAV